MVEERVTYIDFAKGMVVLLMIMGHCLQPIDIYPSNIIRGLIYSFHMPFFFIIAGMLKTENHNTRMYIRKKTKRMILPFIIFNILYIIANCLERANLGTDDIKKNLTNFIVYGGNSVSWFLMTLFVVEILYQEMKIKVPRQAQWLLVLSGIAGLLLGKLRVGSIFKIGTILTCLPIYGFANLYKDDIKEVLVGIVRPTPNSSRLRLHPTDAEFFCLWIVASLTMIITTGDTWELNSNYVSDIMLGLISAFSGTICVLLFSKLIVTIDNDTMKKVMGSRSQGFWTAWGSIVSVIEFIGKKSLWFYL